MPIACGCWIWFILFLLSFIIKPSGRFDVDPTINTDNVMGASQNTIGPNEIADYYNSQQFMDGGIVDLVDIYDWL